MSVARVIRMLGGTGTLDAEVYAEPGIMALPTSDSPVPGPQANPESWLPDGRATPGRLLPKRGIDATSGYSLTLRRDGICTCSA